MSASPKSHDTSPSLHHEDDEQYRIALIKGLAIGTFVIFPVLMFLFAITIGAEGTVMVAVAAGTFMMAELLGGVFGMGLYGPHS